MKKQTDVAIEARISRGAFYLLLLTAGTMMAFLGPQTPTKILPRTLSFAERVAYQRAIEDVYWRHRIWPKENPNPKPSLDAVMSQAQIEKKVEDYLLNSEAVEDYYKEPLSAEQLQREMERMARDTRQPELLRELFEALGNAPFVIAECLARPVLAERMITSLHVTQTKTGLLRPNVVASPIVNYALPTISDGATGCTDDTWTVTSTANAPSPRFYHTAVWTGSEMIVWGGTDNTALNTGGRYNPSTDSWTGVSTTNAPPARYIHTAVWNGDEMIVFGGWNGTTDLNTGGRYNPVNDSWTATTTTNAPAGRSHYTAIWTGIEMIVWGGHGDEGFLNTGGRYNPSTDTWTGVSTTNAPPARFTHTAVWSGNDMIIWGGGNENGFLRSGGRYNPSTDTWTATTTTHAPTARASHTAVWTGSEMIVWGGNGIAGLTIGGRYNPLKDAWANTSATNAPIAREMHTAIWTGIEMMVWGGFGGSPGFSLNSGGRYNPTADSWTDHQHQQHASCPLRSYGSLDG